jgi:hypothetical protein
MVGNICQTTVTNLLAGTNYFFFVTAHNQWLIESDPSNVITDTPVADKPSPPKNLRITTKLQASLNLKDWSDVTNWTYSQSIIDTNNIAAFRGVLAAELIP